MLHLPVVAATLAVVILSLGYDMTQSLLAGIVTSLGGKQLGGQAMGLNVFTVFTGMGIGSYVFGEALRLGFGSALMIFSAVQLMATLAAIPLFASETTHRSRAEVGAMTIGEPGAVQD